MKVLEIIGFFILALFILHLIISILIGWFGWKVTKYFSPEESRTKYTVDMGAHSAKVFASTLAKPVTIPARKAGQLGEKALDYLDPVEKEKREFFRKRENKKAYDEKMKEIMTALMQRDVSDRKDWEKKAKKYAKAKADSRLFYEPKGYYGHSVYLNKYEGRGF